MQVLTRLEVLAGQAVRLIAVNGHGDEQIARHLLHQPVWIGDVLKAVPAGDGRHRRPVRIAVAAPRRQPGHRFRVNVEAEAIRLQYKAPATDADIHHLAVIVTRNQAQPGTRQGLTHRAGVQLLILLEIRAAVAHRRARMKPPAQLIRPQQAVRQPTRQRVRHSQGFSCRSRAACVCSGRNCLAPRR